MRLFRTWTNKVKPINQRSQTSLAGFQELYLVYCMVRIGQELKYSGSRLLQVRNNLRLKCQFCSVGYQIQDEFTLSASESCANILISKFWRPVALSGFLWNQCDILSLFWTIFFASVVATLFVCVNNFYLGAVVSVVCPPMLRLLSAAPCPQGSRYTATLPARRERPIETHRCDSSVLCCLNSITQQIMMIMIEVLVPNNPGHVFIGL